MTKKSFSHLFQPECLILWANEHCSSEFKYGCETNDQNVSVTNLSQQKMTEMSQWNKNSHSPHTSFSIWLLGKAHTTFFGHFCAML